MEIIKRADILIISKLTWPSFYFNRSKMEGELRLVSKKKTTSAVWVHFGIAVDEDGKATTENEATCRICFKKVSIKGGTTSNLSSHLKVKHPAESARLQPSASPSQSNRAGPSRSNLTTITDAFTRPKRKFYLKKEINCQWCVIELPNITKLCKPLLLRRQR